MIRPAIQSIEFPTAPVDASRTPEAIDWSLELTSEAVSVDERLQVKRGAVSSAVRVAGILAFAQSVLFLALWLWLCASAGAAVPQKKAEFKADMQISKYQPGQARDPFSPVGGYANPAAAAASVTLHLEGILYSATEPSAIVNGQLLTLNKPAKLDAGGGAEVKVMATVITRDRVVVEVGTSKVELFLNQQANPPATGSK